MELQESLPMYRSLLMISSPIVFIVERMTYDGHNDDDWGDNFLPLPQ
jgi:hypothetical protein